jgi:hypothetical protein
VVVNIENLEPTEILEFLSHLCGGELGIGKKIGTMYLSNVHHHIGGLEITLRQRITPYRVHHHIGGLEIK